MDRPISWYCGPFPKGPSRMNKNLWNKKNKRFWVNIGFFSGACRGMFGVRYLQGFHVHKVFQFYLVVMGTSVRPLSSTAGDRRTKATTGRSRKSSSPTKTLEASAPGGIFFMKWRSICWTGRDNIQNFVFGQKTGINVCVIKKKCFE